QPEQALVVHDVTLASEQHVQAPIAEASSLVRQRLHALAENGIAVSSHPVSDRRPAATQDVTRPPFAHAEPGSEMSDSLSLHGGRHHFFPRRSFSAALSSIASARSFFSRPFSS